MKGLERFVPQDGVCVDGVFCGSPDGRSAHLCVTLQHFFAVPGSLFHFIPRTLRSNSTPTVRMCGSSGTQSSALRCGFPSMMRGVASYCMKGHCHIHRASEQVRCTSKKRVVASCRFVVSRCGISAPSGFQSQDKSGQRDHGTYL